MAYTENRDGIGFIKELPKDYALLILTLPPDNEKGKAAVLKAGAPEVVIVKTEHLFREHFYRIAQEPPSLIIAEAILRWTDPAPDMQPPPEDVSRAGFYYGGLRCLKRLAEDPRTANVPRILWTVLSDYDIKNVPEGLIPGGTVIINKQCPGDENSLPNLRGAVGRVLK